MMRSLYEHITHEMVEWFVWLCIPSALRRSHAECSTTFDSRYAGHDPITYAERSIHNSCSIFVGVISDAGQLPRKVSGVLVNWKKTPNICATDSQLLRRGLADVMSSESRLIITRSDECNDTSQHCGCAFLIEPIRMDAFLQRPTTDQWEMRTSEKNTTRINGRQT